MNNNPTPKRHGSDLFFQERIEPCHAGGWWWTVEGLDVVEALHGEREAAFSNTHVGHAAFRWLARRRIAGAKKRMREEYADA